MGLFNFYLTILNRNSSAVEKQTGAIFRKWQIENVESKILEMEQTKRSTDKLISTIYEYQKYIKLNKQFIRQMEAEGADTRSLKNEVDELERRIEEMKMQSGMSL
jgi:hypothetical protein